ncbi:MAG: hypothetical protein LH679_18505 [Cyanobacteria bacterium CAN_BIN43]|nr:hypothetical protein [Cyanobacteria bacterium CAN_BIN43]
MTFPFRNQVPIRYEQQLISASEILRSKYYINFYKSITLDQKLITLAIAPQKTAHEISPLCRVISRQRAVKAIATFASHTPKVVSLPLEPPAL